MVVLTFDEHGTKNSHHQDHDDQGTNSGHHDLQLLSNVFQVVGDRRRQRFAALGQSRESVFSSGRSGLIEGGDEEVVPSGGSQVADQKGPLIWGQTVGQDEVVSLVLELVLQVEIKHCAAAAVPGTQIYDGVS